MRLSIKGVAIAGAIIWGGGILCVGLVHAAGSAYGGSFLDAISSIYPGFHGARSFGDAIVGGLYASLDGGVGGAIFAWLYNRFAPQTP